MLDQYLSFNFNTNFEKLYFFLIFLTTSFFFLDLLGDGGLLTDDVLLSALGDDVNFDLIDDINQQQEHIDESYEEVSSNDQRGQGYGFVVSPESGNGQHGQFRFDASAALSSPSSDPKLFNPASPDAENIGLSQLTQAKKEQNSSVISSVPIQLTPQQYAALQQQQMLQVRIKVHGMLNCTFGLKTFVGFTGKYLFKH